MRRREFAVGLAALGVAGCTAPEENEPADPSPSPTPSRTPSASASPTPSVTPTPTPTPTPSLVPRPARFEVATAVAVITALAGRIGPREASSAGYRAAAMYVEGRFTAAGLEVGRQAVRVPAGTSWGVRVPSGQADNVIATPPGFDGTRPHLVVGAHLDTVPQAPGAEDNASGVAIVLELARMAVLRPPRVPVVFVAFAAEEPRGDGDLRHHFGSRHYLAQLPAEERRAIRGMVSLDRVGTGPNVRVRTGGRAAMTVADALVAAGRRVRIATSRGTNRGSDHWSFEKAGIAAARVGGHGYAGYHNANDKPNLISRPQLVRTAVLVWAYLQ